LDFGKSSLIGRSSVGDLDPVEVATQTLFRVATEYGSRPKKNYPITNQTWSRPELDDRVDIFCAATRSKMSDCFHQAVYSGKFSEKVLGHDPKNFLDRDRLRVATGMFFGSRPDPVATYGSMVPNTRQKFQERV
jgi:hypothetical protein